MMAGPVPAAGPLRVDLRGGHLLLTLNRPDKLNALNRDVLAALEAALRPVAGDPAVRSVIVTGAGDRAFCAGADLAELRGLGAAGSAATLANGQRIIGLFGSIGVPVIAAVNGFALGGGFEIALASTFVLASTNASFGLPETGLGLIPGYGGTQRLPRLVGRQAAAYLITTGQRWSAEQAYQRGLLAEPPIAADGLLARAEAVAEEIAGRGAFATRTALSLLAASETGMPAGLAHESDAAALAACSDEAAQRVAAFLDRRPARPANG
jgi:enoyl-CoA hydratase